MAEFILYPGEREAVATVLAAGKQYGYGNLIAHLKRAWALELLASHRKHGVKRASYAGACKAADVDAYPEDFALFDADVAKTGKARC